MAAGARALAGRSLGLVAAFEGCNGEMRWQENNATIIKFSEDENNVLDAKRCCGVRWGKYGLYVKDPGMTFRAFVDQLIAKQHTNATDSPSMMKVFCTKG